jgi:sulfonate transport system permease protein
MIRIANGHTGMPRPKPARSRFGFRVPPRLRGWVIPVAGFLIWGIASRFQWPRESLFVSPQQVAASGIGLAETGQLLPAVGASLVRLALGFTLGSVLGLALGTLFGVSRTVERILGPTFHAVKQVSLFAWIPLIAMWFGLGESSKIAVLSYSAFFPMLLNTYEGVRSVPREHLEAARAFAFTRPQILIHVILPSALPSIFTGISLALIYAWVSTLGAEYLLTSSVGLGTLLVEGREHAQMDQVLFAVFMVGCVGQLLNFLSSRLESHFLRWRGVSTGRY